MEGGEGLEAYHPLPSALGPHAPGREAAGVLRHQVSKEASDPLPRAAAGDLDRNGHLLLRRRVGWPDRAAEHGGRHLPPPFPALGALGGRDRLAGCGGLVATAGEALLVGDLRALAGNPEVQHTAVGCTHGLLLEIIGKLFPFLCPSHSS